MGNGVDYSDPLTAGLEPWTEDSPLPPGRFDVARGVVPIAILDECRAYQTIFGHWPDSEDWLDRLELIREGMRLKDRKEALGEFQTAEKLLTDTLDMGPVFEKVVERIERRALSQWLPE